MLRIRSARDPERHGRRRGEAQLKHAPLVSIYGEGRLWALQAALSEPLRGRVARGVDERRSD
eukprot:852777-Alexandrium_andersonii.AAC.1